MKLELGKYYYHRDADYYFHVTSEFVHDDKRRFRIIRTITSGSCNDVDCRYHSACKARPETACTRADKDYSKDYAEEVPELVWLLRPREHD